MQQSTTVRSCWVIEKYSRSKSAAESKKGAGSFSSSVSKGATGDAIEWEHRTQKQHYLTIDAVSSSSAVPGGGSTLQSMTLKILFDALASTSAENPSPSHQQITLLSLDLVSFSDPALVACLPEQQLPLKAVYKGTVLGLRYLHVPDNQKSKGSAARTEFKRVQVKFTSVEERNRFVQTVRSVCPVKLAEGATEEDRQLPSPKKSRRSKESDSVHSTDETTRSADFTMARDLTSKSAQPHAETEQPAAKPAPARSTTRPALPPSISALLPSLASKLSPSRHGSYNAVSSIEMANLDDETFAELFGEVLEEDGFDSLVARVQGFLNASVGIE